MIRFFKTPQQSVIATEVDHQLTTQEVNELCWLFGEATLAEDESLAGQYIGPRREMVTPWSTNAVEITQNMGLNGISRIEEYFPAMSEKPGTTNLAETDKPNTKPHTHSTFDPMLQRKYDGLDQNIFTINIKPEPIKYIENLEEYNEQEGLALSPEEINYLHGLEKQNGRPLTDSEIFGFAQINSEHCRHKIFGGTFIIDGQEMESSLFQMIKKTTQENPNKILSAYKDNVAFAQGPVVEQFAPRDQSTSDYFQVKDIESVISLKAETHNFPTTVEPFNGAATGTGGEIRDRMGGGVGSWPIAGTAVYMTAYPRLHDNDDNTRDWENILPVRQWLYQTPEQILIKASNGASDFGNKFGQPLICGSVLTFEHQEKGSGNDAAQPTKYAYDKVIMLAGGVGYGTKRDCLKKEPQPGNKIVVVGGDNYRIGLGGGSVSSVDTGRYSNGIELNAVQRSNPEMQKRVLNAIRGLVESDNNPIVSIHDHGAGGHLNCLSELVEETGGNIDMDALPIGDKTLSDREIVGNESQERMGLVLNSTDVDRLRKIADRERAPMYVVGRTTGDMNFTFSHKDGTRPIDWKLSDMFGNPPKTIMTDNTVSHKYAPVAYDQADIPTYIRQVMKLESVGCKDWLTNKVDRSVTGKVAKQQCAGKLQLPLNDLGAVALDYNGRSGMATSVGHAPAVGLIDPAAGSVMSVAEALTNIVFAPLSHGLSGVSLSANWMWPCRQPGEDARLYAAVQAMSDFVCQLGINIPTGKDSLSMTQKYSDGKTVLSPGTVIISAMGEVSNIRNIVEPVLINDENTSLIHVDFSNTELSLGGSALAQVLGRVGDKAPSVASASYFAQAFNAVQQLINDGLVLAGHDISAGGLITTLLEMTYANTFGGITADFSTASADPVLNLFAENPGVVLQVADINRVSNILSKAGVKYTYVGRPQKERQITISAGAEVMNIDIDNMRDEWFRTSALLDALQSGEAKANERMTNYKNQPINYVFPNGWTGSLADLGIALKRTNKTGVKAAIIREKGINGDREMAYSLFLAGFDVKDVHMTDLVSGRETLEDVNMIVFCGGFSNSDVLGSAKGWAGAFLYNDKARQALERFYARPDTLSLGVCNGCQLVIELGLLHRSEPELRPKMLHNDSHKFESAFLSLTIPQNETVMFGNLSGSQLGIWVAHGEGKFSIPADASRYNVVARYAYSGYPANPNGSADNIAGMASADGRHVAIMPHLERAIFPWQCAYYPAEHLADDVTPWIQSLINARKWVENKIKK